MIELKSILGGIGRKIGVLSGMLILTLIFTVGYSLFKAETNINSLVSAQEVGLSADERIKSVTDDLSNLRYWLGDLLATWEKSSADQAMSIKKSLDANLNSLREVRPKLAEDLATQANALNGLLVKAVTAYASGETDAAKKLIVDIRVINDTLAGIIKANFLANKEANKVVIAKAHKGMVDLRNGLMAQVGFTLVFCVLIAWLLQRSITKPIFGRLSDLTSVGESTRHSSVRLTEVSHKAFDASESVSQGAQDQAVAIQEMVASMSEITSMVTQTANQAQEAQEIAKDVSEKTEFGSKIMSEMVGSSDDIKEAIDGIREAMTAMQEATAKIQEATNTQLENISGIIKEIASKTNVINDIVLKTQLLSFNASIEAARAGQHGRGFAVVAEEVGNLAQLSGGAATEIHTLLQGSLTQVDDIINSTKSLVQKTQDRVHVTNELVEQTQTKVHSGKKISADAQVIFEEIANEVMTISRQVENVNGATKEQKIGIEQVLRAMNKMDQNTQANNQAAQQASAISSELQVQSLDLRDQSGKLKSIATEFQKVVLGTERPIFKGFKTKSSEGSTLSIVPDANVSGGLPVHSPKNDDSANSNAAPLHEASQDQMVRRLQSKVMDMSNDENITGDSATDDFNADDASFEEKIG